MPNQIDTRNADSLTGAVYFVVGRGTEGGSASYRLSVAGVTARTWGQVGEVAQNSGYSMGAIQVDFGQRGAWPLGATEGRSLREGEMSYVDAVIAKSSAYAVSYGLPYAADHAQLRADLLTHGNGQGRRSSINFIDTDTRDSINAWASSSEGKQWIHRNIDYGQVRNATNTATDLLDKYPSSVGEEHRFAAVCLLAKTANQFPGYLGELESVLKSGGDYADLADKAEQLSRRNSVFAGNKARLMAEKYESIYNEPTRQRALDRAHAKVSSHNFDPSSEATDLDIQAALNAIGQRSRNRAASDPTVEQLQQNLNQLGIPDARGQSLAVDGNRGGPGSRTNEAIAAFQRSFGLQGRDLSNAELLTATQVAINANPARNFDQALREVLPESVQQQPASRMVNGMPDYLLPGRDTANRTASAPHAPTHAPVAHGTHPPPPAEPTRLPPMPPVEQLQPGAQGAAVFALQEHLRLLHARDAEGRQIRSDSDYGERTQEVVENFQLWAGLPTTGVADRATLDALKTHAAYALEQRAKGIAPGEHLADNLKPAAFDAQVATTERPVPGRSQADALLPFSNPDHPQHALYADMQQRFQAKGHALSEEQLSVLTGQLHLARYQPGWEGDVIVYHGKAVAQAFQLCARPASVELNAPAPAVQETMQTFQADERTREQSMEAFRQQQAMAQEHGHGLTR